MRLIDQIELEQSIFLPQWYRTVGKSLSERLKEPSSFPCPFSLKSYSKKLIKYAFIDDNSQSSINELGKILREFADISRQWDGNINTAHPLVVAFSLSATEKCVNLSSYHKFGWDILQKLNEIDHKEWPENVPKDPNSPFWSWCFDGMQFFVNMSAPAYVKRKSRNLGPHFLFIINPRERFDIVAGNNPSGHKLRQTIRNRISNYDNFAYSPQLGHYQAGELEWYQYDLIDENIERKDQCPFHVKTNL